MRLALILGHVAVDVAVRDGWAPRGREDRRLRLVEELLDHLRGRDVALASEDPEGKCLDEEGPKGIAFSVAVPVLRLLDGRLRPLRPSLVRRRELGRVGLGIALLPVRLGLALADLEDRAIAGLG